ncbi:NAD(P)/FAD-dependent oxidoreductase, partial [Aquamicrobium sp. NLF2-7]
DPEANAVVTTTGQRIDYDFLMVATGLKLNYEAIEGMDVSLIGENGIASIYAGPEQARASAAAIDRFIDTGGVGLFGRPAGEMKCAGAPLKITFITDDKARSKTRRGAVELIYNAHNPAVFSVAAVNDKVTDMFAGRDIAVNYSHVLKAIDPGAKQATYATDSGDITLDYDFIHVVPPMRAPDAVLASPLPWQDGALAADGWIEADRATLRHPRYPNVFAVGDIAGVPRGKTAASVKWQVPVVVDNLVAETAGRAPQAVYNGYTSCPMVTGIGKAMLIEFDYDGNLIPSFPFIDPLKELWVSWLIEEKGLLGAYRAMLRGRA